MYGNPKYYNQKTGRTRWPKNEVFLAGTRVDNAMVPEGTLFKRYGDPRGSFLGNTTDSYASRALAPDSEGVEVHYYRLARDCEMTTGKAAPWFDSEGGAEQFVKYKADGNKFKIEELIKEGFLIDITELVRKGEIIIG